MTTRPQSTSRLPSPPPRRQLLVLFLMLLHLSLSSASPVSLQLYHNPPSSTLTTTTTTDAPPVPDPYRALAALATASLLRARHLKNRTTTHPAQFKPAAAAARSQAPLSPHAYGGYTVTLALGTPPQEIPLVFDTGSDLTWVPCTSSYACSNCPEQDSGTGSSTRVFLPKASSTARLVGCRNPKCGWIHSPRTLVRRCPSCSTTGSGSSSAAPTPDTGADNCSSQPQVCPPYLILYGSGSTGGVLLSETLQLSVGDPASSSPEAPAAASTPDFAVGCSVFSTHQPPAGIAAFGRGPASFGSQLHLSSFSYCLVPRRFDDVPGKAGSLVLNDNLRDEDDDPVNAAADHAKHLSRWSSTPLLENLAAADGNSGAASPDQQRNTFGVYYYVGVRRITVGGRKVKVPQELLVPGGSRQGDGGAIIDSGSTFTYMDPVITRLVVGAFEAAVAGRYNRSKEAETRAGLRLCFDVSAGSSSHDDLRLPALELQFKGGARMTLPLENYFAVIGGDDSDDVSAVCLMVVSDDNVDGTGGGRNLPRLGSGPSIILGAFQQQNYRMVFDLNNRRLRFRSQRCVADA